MLTRLRSLPLRNCFLPVASTEGDSTRKRGLPRASMALLTHEAEELTAERLLTDETVPPRSSLAPRGVQTTLLSLTKP